MKLFFVFYFLIILSCGSNRKLNNSDYQVIRFKEEIPDGAKIKVQDYLFDVIGGGILNKGKHKFTGSNYSEYRVNYPDSSILYIGNDVWHCSRLNLNNRISQGINGISRKKISDSIYFGGVQFDGKYWKEQILNDIYVGYINVRPEQKDKYDKVIQSVRINKKR